MRCLCKPVRGLIWELKSQNIEMEVDGLNCVLLYIKELPFILFTLHKWLLLGKDPGNERCAILQVAMLWLHSLERVNKHTCQALLSSNVRLQQSLIGRSKIIIFCSVIKLNQMNSTWTTFISTMRNVCHLSVNLHIFP